MFLLDTNVCIHVLNGTSTSIVDQLRAHQPGDILLSSVVRAELFFGARKSARVDQNLRLLERFFAPYRSVAFDDRCAEHYGLLRATLERAGQPIGPNDMLIAATALAHDATLVTSNTREFGHAVGLRLLDWHRDSPA
jgi:tRNA(fMet)-specific endonuclease VapC